MTVEGGKESIIHDTESHLLHNSQTRTHTQTHYFLDGEMT